MPNSPNSIQYTGLLLLAALCISCNSTTQQDIQTNNAFFISTSSNHQHFNVVFKTEKAIPLPVNQFHHWLITLKDQDGNAIYPARLIISGGMPAHKHGLPTQPTITKYLGNGQYLLEGMKFNMAGEWVVNLNIATQTQQDTAQITFHVSY